MNFSDVLGRAFRALKSGKLWAFAAGAGALATIPVLLGYSGYAVLYGSIANNLVTADGPKPGDLGTMFLAFGVLTLGVLISIIPEQIFAAGLIHMSDSVIAQRTVDVREAWAEGWRRAGRTFGIRFVVGLAVGVVMAILGGILAVVFTVGGISLFADEPSGSSVAAGVIIFIVVMLLVMTVSLIAWAIMTAWGELSILYGVLGGRTIGQALSAGWQAFMARKKHLLQFLLILLGLTIGYQIASSFILMPLQFAGNMSAFDFSRFADPDYVPDVSRTYEMMPLFYSVSLLVGFPFRVFLRVVWVGFFRQLVGLDVPPPRFGYAAQPTYAPGYPQPPAQPPYAPEYPEQPTQPPYAPEYPQQPAQPPAAPMPPGPPVPPAPAGPPIAGQQPDQEWPPPPPPMPPADA